MADNKTVHVSTGTGGHADFVPTIWARVAIGVLHRNAMMLRLADRNWEPMLAVMGDTVRIPKRGTLTVQNKTADTAITPQQPSGDKVEVVLDKHKVISFIVEDVAEAQSSVKNMMGYVEDGTKQIAKTMDTDLLSLYSSIGASVGTGGAGIATSSEAQTVLDAKEKFDVREVGDSRNLVISSAAETEFLKCNKFTEADKIGTAQHLRSGMTGRIYGFDTFMDPRVVSTGVSPKSYHNIAFSPGGIALVTRPLALPPRSLGVQAAYYMQNGVGIRIVYGYNMNYMGVQVTMDILYGVKIVDDRLCLEVKS